MEKSNNLLKNTVIIAIGTFATRILSFLLVPFYTMWLSPTEYGNFDLLVTYISLIIPFITFQLEQSIFRFCLEDEKNSNKYFNNAIIIVLINMVICDVIIYCLLHSKNYMLYFMIYFNSYAIYNCASELLRGTKKLKKYSFCNILVSLLIVLLNIILVYKMKLQVNGMLLSYGIAYLIGSLYIIITERKIVKLNMINKNIQKRMLKYSIPLIPNSISWWITNVSDRTIIKIMIGNFYNGIYAVSCKIPSLINLLFSIFNMSWQQTVIESIKDKDKNEFYNNIFTNLIKFLFTGALCIIAITPFIFKYFIDDNYYEGIYQVPILLNGIIFLSMAQFLSAIFLANMKTKSVGLSTTLAAIINLIINVILIKKIGLFAASISTLVSYVVLFVVRYISLRKIFNCKKDIFNIITLNIVYIFFVTTIFINSIIYKFLLLIISIIIFIISNQELEKIIISKVKKY